MKCNNGCDTEIYFDNAIRGPKGNPIPLESDNDLPHDCPNKKDNDEKFIGQEIMDLENRERQNLGYDP